MHLFRNWRFRDARPSFAPGDEIRAYLTSFDPATGEGVARIGDTLLKVKGATAGLVDQLVSLRVEEFDAAQAAGRAVIITTSDARNRASA